MRRRRPAADPAAPAGARNGVVSKAPSVESAGDDGGQHRHQQELENDLPLSRVLLASLPLLVLSAVASTHQVGLYKLSADLLIAAIRTLAQLSCLALVLTPIFHSENHSRLFTCSYVFLFMLPLAAYEATARSDLTYPGAYRDSLLGLGIGVVATLSLAVFGVVRSSPWYSPRVVIPLGGMLISNALSGMSLASSELLEELHNRSERIEVLLAFGATPWEATRMAMSSALGKALMPTISSMNVIGLVAIPGMMTGQVLSGASPVRAGRYQIMILYMIAACTFLATAVTVSLMVENLFDGRGVYRAKDVVKNDAPGVSRLLSSGTSLKVLCPVSEGLWKGSFLGEYRAVWSKLRCYSALLDVYFSVVPLVWSHLLVFAASLATKVTGAGLILARFSARLTLSGFEMTPRKITHKSHEWPKMSPSTTPPQPNFRHSCRGSVPQLTLAKDAVLFW